MQEEDFDIMKQRIWKILNGGFRGKERVVPKKIEKLKEKFRTVFEWEEYNLVLEMCGEEGRKEMEERRSRLSEHKRKSKFEEWTNSGGALSEASSGSFMVDSSPFTRCSIASHSSSTVPPFPSSATFASADSDNYVKERVMPLSDVQSQWKKVMAVFNKLQDRPRHGATRTKKQKLGAHREFGGVHGTWDLYSPSFYQTWGPTGFRFY